MTIYGLFLLNENSRGPWTRQTFFDFLNGIFPLGICVERCVKLSRLLILRHSSRFVNAYCFSQTAHSYLVLFQWTYRWVQTQQHNNWHNFHFVFLCTQCSHWYLLANFTSPSIFMIYDKANFLFPFLFVHCFFYCFTATRCFQREKVAVESRFRFSGNGKWRRK